MHVQNGRNSLLNKVGFAQKGTFKRRAADMINKGVNDPLRNRVLDMINKRVNGPLRKTPPIIRGRIYPKKYLSDQQLLIKTPLNKPAIVYNGLRKPTQLRSHGARKLRTSKGPRQLRALAARNRLLKKEIAERLEDRRQLSPPLNVTPQYTGAFPSPKVFTREPLRQLPLVSPISNTVLKPAIVQTAPVEQPTGKMNIILPLIGLVGGALLLLKG